MNKHIQIYEALTGEKVCEGRKKVSEETMTIELWRGTTFRPFELMRKCECGCDDRSGDKGFGYLIGCTPDGDGVTIWIRNEEVFRWIEKIIEHEKLKN